MFLSLILSCSCWRNFPVCFTTLWCCSFLGKSGSRKLKVSYLFSLFMKTCFLHLLAKKKRTKEQGVCVCGGGGIRNQYGCWLWEQFLWYFKCKTDRASREGEQIFTAGTVCHSWPTRCLITSYGFSPHWLCITAYHDRGWALVHVRVRNSILILIAVCVLL